MSVDIELIERIIAERTFSHKLKLLKSKRVPEKVKKEIRERLFTPKQKEIIALSRKPDLKLLISHGGTGSGKTYANNYIFLQALKRVRQEATDTKGEAFIPKVILAGYKNENIEHNIISSLRDEFGLDIKFDKKGNFELFGVRVVTTHTKDKSGINAIRGMDAWFAYVNEGTLANRGVIEEIDNRLRSGDSPFMVIDTNPDHPYHWLKAKYIDTCYVLGEERDLKKEEEGTKKPGYYAVHSTPEDNPYVKQGYLDRIYNRPVGPSRERALGYWTTGSGAVYSKFDPRRHFIKKTDLPPRSDFKEFFAGVDWGWSPDPQVFLLFGIADVWNKEEGKSEEIIYLLEEVAANERRMEEWQDLAKEWMNKYERSMPFYCDPSEPSKIADLENIGANAMKADNGRSIGVESVSEEIEYDRFYVVDEGVKVFKTEIGSYEWNEKTGKPQDGNDHTMDAMRYAIHTHKENSNNTVSWY